MATELDELRRLAAQLADATLGRAESRAAVRLAERLEAGEFLISFVGEFKRGKSSLINALVGAEVLPMGVLPLTAIATELRFGEPAARVHLLDGHHLEILPAEIGTYVTEASNPDNALGVERVEVFGRWPLLASGAVLVDTPGIASVHRHNTDAAHQALLDADGAVLVLSVDSPLSEDEQALLATLGERRSPTFVVLNKSDHLDDAELDQVRRFVSDLVCERLGTKTEVFTLSARHALAARRQNPPSADPQGSSGQLREGGQFDEFEAALRRFIEDDLVAARTATARRELHRLAGATAESLTLTDAAFALDVDALAQRLELFGDAVATERAAFEDDRLLLRRDVEELGRRLGGRLRTFAASAALPYREGIDRVATQAPRGELVDALRATIEDAVRTSFDEQRPIEATWLDGEWQAIAARFRERAHQRVEAVVAAARGLFDVTLHTPQLPTVAAERDRFSYLFLYVGPHEDPVVAAFERLVPGRIARRRARHAAWEELRGELDKHAGRARWDMAQRLEAAAERFVAQLRAELEATVEAITAATERADQLRRATAQDRATHRRQTERLRALCATIEASGGGEP